MHYVTCIIVLICSTNLATAGLLDQFKGLVGGAMQSFMGPNSPFKEQIGQMMAMAQMAQAGGADMMEKIPEKFAQIMQMANGFTGAGAQQVKAMADQAMKGFQQLQETNASPAQMLQFIQVIMQQMNG